MISTTLKINFKISLIKKKVLVNKPNMILHFKRKRINYNKDRAVTNTMIFFLYINDLYIFLINKVLYKASIKKKILFLLIISLITILLR